MKTSESTLKEESTDKWQAALDKKILRLQECQSKERLQSCFTCDKLLECDLRKEYIQAVYASMSKGSGGGFEF